MARNFTLVRRFDATLMIEPRGREKKLGAFIPFPRTLLGIWRAHQLPVHRAKTISHGLSAIHSFGDLGYFHSPVLALSTNHFPTSSLSTLSTAYRLVTVPIFGSPLFLPRASEKFEKRITHIHVICARAKAYTMLARVTGRMNLRDRGTGRKEISRSEQMFETSCRGLASF